MQMEVINKRNVLILQKVFQYRGWNRKQGDNIDEKVNIRRTHFFSPPPFRCFNNFYQFYLYIFE